MFSRVLTLCPISGCSPVQACTITRWSLTEDIDALDGEGELEDDLDDLSIKVGSYRTETKERRRSSSTPQAPGDLDGTPSMSTMDNLRKKLRFRRRSSSLTVKGMQMIIVVAATSFVPCLCCFFQLVPILFLLCVA